MKYLFAFCLGLSVFGPLIGQPVADGQVRETIKALRRAYLIDKLELSAEEADAFWPLYDAFLDEQEAIVQRYRPARPLSIDNMTDAQVEARIAAELEREQAILDLKKDYYERLKRVLPPRKIAKLERANKLFNALLLERLKERREKRQDGQGLRQRRRF